MEIHLEELQHDDDSLDNEWLCNKKEGKGYYVTNWWVPLFPINSWGCTAKKGFTFHPDVIKEVFAWQFLSHDLKQFKVVDYQSNPGKSFFSKCFSLIFFRVPKSLIFTALISLKWTSYSSQPKPSRCSNIKKKFKVCWVCSLKYYRGWDKNSSMNSKFIFKNDD